MTVWTRHVKSKLREETGLSLVEAMISILILIAGLLFMVYVMTFSVMASKTLGRDAGKTTMAARDKMEELLGLAFNDTTSNVTVAAPFPATGAGLAAGGSVYPANPVAGYADYIAPTGLRTDAGSSAFTRQWQVVNNSASLKTIIVSVCSNKSFKFGTAPVTTFITQKASIGQ